MRAVFAVLFAFALAAPVSAAGPQRAPGWIGIAFEVKSGDASFGAAAVVTEVRAGSPAATAGIQVGDELLTINGVSTVGNFDNLGERLALRVGDRVQIRMQRAGRRVDLALTAGQRPTDFGMLVSNPGVTADSMAESMYRAIDSLRAQILATWPVAPAAPTTRVRLVSEPQVAPEPPEPVDAPFEFFIFRGEQHDSLEMEMEALNRRIASLREAEQRLTDRGRVRSASRSESQAVNEELNALRDQVTQVTREASALRAAMAEAARATAAVEYFAGRTPGAPEATFRPLTPYLLGSNRVAGAEVVDLRPGLSEYFGVDTGVLVVDVAPGTPAAIAGIQPGDVIMNLDRVGIRTVDELRTGISRAGDALPVTLVRQGARIEVLLRRR